MLSAHHGSRPRESRKGHRSSKLLLNSPLLVDQDVATTTFSPGDTARGGKYGTTDVKVEESSACTCGQEEESERVYLDVKIKGRNRQCLLDSDCDFTVIPAKYVSPTSIVRSSRTLLAANGTPIPIIGSALLRGTVGRQTVEISGLVTDHVHDIMLRVDWLRAYEVNWNFANSTVNIGGATNKLVSRGRKNNITCRRVIVTEDTVVPPWSQSNVSTDTVYDRLKTEGPVEDAVWATSPVGMKNGLLVARFLVPNKLDKILVRVTNPTDKPVYLCRGTEVTDLEEVEKLQKLLQDRQGVVQEKKPEEDMERIIGDLMEKVDKEVPAEKTEELKNVLRKHSRVFSKGE